MSSTYSGKSVAIASSTNASPIVVTTSSAHGLANGDKVLVVNHDNYAANGDWTITVLSPTTFSLAGSTGSSAGTATGSVSTLASSITIPSDGDLRDAASVNPGFEGLSDQVQYILSGLSATPRIKMPNLYVASRFLGGFIQNRIVEIRRNGVSSDPVGDGGTLLSNSTTTASYSLTGTFTNDSKPGDLMILIGSIIMSQAGGGGPGIGFFSTVEGGVRTDQPTSISIPAGTAANANASATVFGFAPCTGGTSPTFSWGIKTGFAGATTTLVKGSDILGILLRP